LFHPEEDGVHWRGQFDWVMFLLVDLCKEGEQLESIAVVRARLRTPQ